MFRTLPYPHESPAPEQGHLELHLQTCKQCLQNCGRHCETQQTGVGGWGLILSPGYVAAIPAEERDKAHCKDKGGT